MALGRNDDVARASSTSAASVRARSTRCSTGQRRCATVHTVAQRPAAADRRRRGATARSSSARSRACCASTASTTRLAAPPAPVVVSDRFPSETHHGRSFIAFGPDGKLYVPVGAPCNICLPSDRHGVIQRMERRRRGAIETRRARRAQLGRLRLEPAPTRTLWFTDNGRDMLGDDLPADELDRVDAQRRALRLSVLPPGRLARSRVRRAARRAASSRRRRPSSARTSPRSACASTPARSFRRSTAATSSSPSTARGTAAGRVGYQVVRVAGRRAGPRRRARAVSAGIPAGRRSGAPSRCWGRPADVLPLPDGSLLVSDDTAGAIYRDPRTVSRSGDGRGAVAPDAIAAESSERTKQAQMTGT